jgi:hypothetical protein
LFEAGPDIETLARDLEDNGRARAIMTAACPPL